MSERFRVVLARSGLTLEVGPEETILDVVEAAGISVPISCVAGICGTCETKVLAGLPDHQDAVLTEAERACNDAIMICCSRAFSPELVLDL